ncbi:U3 snoRNA-associated protein UTP13 [Aspergillus clavatus NRRL 1]|uniref:Small nucleolar ribonucleoprotein complex subunit, putative n=1 Tax=Aspergillus clavatus (strain ATCC 1007 / CBS 513.65 / DSM 816 / NCTC 3887 / NRRL 1 / QM 1276 / 107) TaxID=344612 RepID=A1CH64_ASPCL|nr:small nucleolar ribonucleoprotein complex subunit, putative [Aspergillus clavatus NRRL 1]EAW10219.1 small nucleolar ribonucleoprotein complex subunit, putative [Aspergillus clavatus NRRL 1]
MSKAVVKTTFEASRTLRPIYTGGSTALDASGRLLVTCVGEDALIVDLETGDQLASLEGDGEIITSLAISPSASHVIICSRSMAMRIYSLSPYEETSRTIETTLLRTLKPHTAPVVTIAVDPTSTLLATGAADGSIKVWDIRGGYITHTFHGHGGVISALCFFQVPLQDGDGKSLKKKQSKKNLVDMDGDEDMAEPSTVTGSVEGFRLASGDEEGKVRVWDLNKRKPIASLDAHVSVVRGLSYSPTENALLSAARDKTVIVWDVKTLKTRRIIPVLESVEAAAFVADSGLCMVAGENGKLRVWDCNRGGEVTSEQEPGPDFEAVVAIHYFPGMAFTLTVHADQTLKLHSLESLSDFTPGSTLDPLAVVRRISGNDDDIIDLAYVGPDRSMLALATNTESIRIVSVSPSKDRPSSLEGEYFGADVAHLEGHDDIIICIDVDWSGHWLATGAKDNSARLWRLDPKTSSYTCFAAFTGHAESLGAISLPRVPPPANTPARNDPLDHPPSFLLTGSQDRTIKRWDTGKLAALTSSKPHAPKALYTRKAHEKDINALDINPSSTLFASASQDRTVKIWSTEDGSVVGVLRGHKRGVWSVRFAPHDTPVINSDTGSSTNRGLIATGSGDKTVKLWSLSDYSCLLTFEGHTNSVLKVIWLPPSEVSTKDVAEEDEDAEASPRNPAIQPKPLLASAAADGLVKIWSPYTGEIETTLDNHTDRVWALASPTPSGSRADAQSPSSRDLSAPYALASGSADSTVTFWTDTTSATYTAAVSANSARIEQDQQLHNYIRAGAYREAITLALQLNHPGRLLSIFSTAIDAADNPYSTDADHNDSANSLTGDPSVDEVLQSLDPSNLRLLLLRLRDWNTNARTSRVAQRILFALFRSYPASTFVELAKSSMAKRGGDARTAAGMKDILQALAAYTERHYRRVEELTDESYLVEWVLSEMDGGISLFGSIGSHETDGGLDEEVLKHEKDFVMLGV